MTIETNAPHPYEESIFLGRGFCSGRTESGKYMPCLLSCHPEEWSDKERARYLKSYRGLLIGGGYDMPVKVSGIREAIRLLTERGFHGRDDIYAAAILVRNLDEQPIAAFAIGADGNWHRVNA